MQSSESTDDASYDVVHTTEYAYSGSVSVSHHIARLTPRRLPHQDARDHVLTVDPPPAVVTTHVDYFGNETTFFAMQGAHEGLTVRASSRVSVRAPTRYDPAGTPSWEMAIDQATLPLEAIECTFDSRSIEWSSELAAYSRRSFAPGRPVLDAVLDLTHRIHADFAFDRQATTIATPLTQVFRQRRGVCQDFARVEIACLRAMGLAARYVSGYLETIPPPGASRLVGADASHAWLAMYCPELGWIDIDPTNDQIPSTQHITLAWGRDYDDVSPMRGVILGGGDHSLKVNVDVNRV